MGGPRLKTAKLVLNGARGVRGAPVQGARGVHGAHARRVHGVPGAHGASARGAHGVPHGVPGRIRREIGTDKHSDRLSHRPVRPLWR